MNILQHPGINNSFYSDFNNSITEHGHIFVFGSNLRGAHGAGAAKIAREKYGAELGVGIGFTGQCYAIPTKDEFIRTLSLERIKRFVTIFKNHTLNTDKTFYVTPIGTGLAGYKHEQIAPMFKGAYNCWFPIEWKQFIID